MKVIFLGLVIFALVGLIAPMTIPTSYADHGFCERGDLSPAELRPAVDINGNGTICVLKIIDTPHGPVVAAIDDAFLPGCNHPPCDAV